MATKTPAAKKAAKPATKQTPKKSTVKKDSPAVTTAKAKVELAKAKVKQVAATENLKAVNAEIKAEKKPAAEVKKIKNSSTFGEFAKPSAGKTTAKETKAAPKKPTVKLAAKKVSKVDKLMKTPPAAPMTETQKVLASLAGTALKQRLGDPAKKQPAPEVQEQAPAPTYERPAVAPQETMSFGERLRAARRNPPPARSAFAERMRRGNRGNY